jgi:hypothetical protein
MEDWKVERYVAELERQIEYVKLSAKALDETIRSNNVQETFRNLHSFLTHAACISKLFWPPEQKSKARGVFLRELLSVKEETSPGLSNRSLRNSLDHFDERLDEAFSKGHGKLFVDSNIGSVGAIDLGPELVFRNYDPTSRIYTFREQDFDLGQICKEVGDIERALMARRTQQAT